MIKGTSISTITVPKNVNSAGTDGRNGPLAGALDLTEVIFEEGMIEIPASICASSDYMSYIRNVRLPSSTKNIGSSAFLSCKSLKEIDIPKAVSTIGNSAFSNCTSLEKVTLHYNDSSVNTGSGTQLHSLTIGSSAFGSCSSLNEINLTENVTSIGDYAFEACTSLSELVLPERLTSLGYLMIKGTSISTITVPKNVTPIYRQTYMTPRNYCRYRCKCW